VVADPQGLEAEALDVARPVEERRPRGLGAAEDAEPDAALLQRGVRLDEPRRLRGSLPVA
jgi:hypothetical protein